MIRPWLRASLAGVRRAARAPTLLAGVLALIVAGTLVAPAAHGASPAVGERARRQALRQRVDALLAHHRLQPESLGVLLYSTREGRYLYEHNIHQPLIAASNAKLITTYTALRVLSPDYRWRTRFFLADAHDDAGGEPRQALVVEGTGDPTLTRADLAQVAWQLRSRGVRRLEGGIFFDGHRFDDVTVPDSRGDVSRAQPWFAPVSPFIVDRNVIDFLISTRPGGAGFEVFTDAAGFAVVASLESAPLSRPALRVAQDWSGDTATFTVHGALAPAREPYRISAAVERPRVHFYQQLRAALEAAGVQGPMPLRLTKPPPGRKHVHTQLSPPLREVIVEVNKHSSNLAAEVLLRTMGLRGKHKRVSAEDGLAVLKRTLREEFPEALAELQVVDGSGLSRDNRVSALLLVRLLNRVRKDFSLRPEFINSLSVALTDGTLQYRNYPWRLRGRLRAKSGTLAGVSNLSGYLQLDHDVVVFAFLINDSRLGYQELQDAQDRVVTDLYDALLAREAGMTLPSPPGSTGPLPPPKPSPKPQPKAMAPRPGARTAQQ